MQTADASTGRRARHERSRSRPPQRARRQRRADRQLLAGEAFAQDPAAPKPPGSLATAPYLDSWIRIDADGGITAFTARRTRSGF